MRKIIEYIAEKIDWKKKNRKKARIDAEEKRRGWKKLLRLWRLKILQRRSEIIQSGRIYNFIDYRAN